MSFIRWNRANVCVLALLITNWSGPLAAQRPNAGTARPVAGTRPAVGFPWISADTGWMAPGWRDFSRYSWMVVGAMCANAISRASALLERDLFVDTMRTVTRMARPHPALALEVGSTCLKTVAPSGFPAVTAGARVPDVMPRIRLAIMQERDSEALGLLAAVIEQLKSESEQAHAIQLTFQDALGARPFRMSLVQSIMAQTDARPRTHRMESLRLQQRQQLVTLTIQRSDPSATRQTIEEVFAFARSETIPPAIKYRIDLQHLGDVLLYLTVLERGSRGAGVQAWLTERLEVGHVVMPPDAQFDKTMVDAFVTTLYQSYLSWIGVRFQVPDSAVRWFTPGNIHPERTGTLTPGRVTLFMRVNQNCGQSCIRKYQWLQSLHQRYGPRGLDIVLSAKTAGYAPRAVGALTPDRENEAIRDYFHDYLRLPFRLVVEETPYRKLPDGRRIDTLTAWERKYVMVPGVNSEAILEDVLIDATGKIHVFNWGAWHEEIMELFIDQVLKQ